MLERENKLPALKTQNHLIQSCYLLPSLLQKQVLLPLTVLMLLDEGLLRVLMTILTYTILLMFLNASYQTQVLGCFNVI